MGYKKTIRAFAAVAVIMAAMLGMSSVTTSRDADVREPDAIVTPTPAAAATIPPTATITPEGTPQPTNTPDRYQGIEPNVTEPPGRVGFVYYPDVDLDEITQDFIFVETGEAAVDYELVIAIIIHESRCDPEAISKTNDYGLMQINQINHEWLAEEYGLTNMLDPRQNIIAGITILAQQSDHDDGTDAGLHKMLMAYNMGPTGAANAWAKGTYSTAYTREVMQIRADLLDGKYGKEEA